MVRNYLKVAWRNIVKNKLMFVINVIGLALGIATCLIISIFVIDELSFDRFNKKADQIVRVNLSAKMGEELINESSVMAPVVSACKLEFPEVEATTRILPTADIAKVEIQGKSFRQGKSAMVDATFFDFFSINFVKGTVQNKPGTVVLTQKQAQIYFGNEDPIYKTIKLKDQGTYTQSGYLRFDSLYTVTGIIEEIPSNAHFHFDILTSMASNKDADSQNWMSGNYHSYLLISKNADKELLESKMKILPEKYMSDQIKSGLGMSYSDFLSKGNRVGFNLIPLTDIHLYSKYGFELEPQGDIKTVGIFLAIALFMLLIACFNFMNLATAAASKRMKEVGMRKVLGSARSQLILQFLAESLILTMVAMAIALIIFSFSIPFFNDISGKSYTLQNLLNPIVFISITILTILISLMAGAYPAFFMSKFKILESLKKRFNTGNSKDIRSGLVVFQFVISGILIVGTLTVNKQMHYIYNKDLGYDRKNLIVIREAGLLKNNFEPFRDMVKKDSRVVSLTTSAFVPAGPSDINTIAIAPLSDPSQRIRSNVFEVDEDYIPTLGMKLLAGRNFSDRRESEVNNIIVNQAAVKALGLNQNPIGQTIEEKSGQNEPTKLLNIVGLVQDFHVRSLHEKIEPLIIKDRPYSGLIVKVKPENTSALIKSMQVYWSGFGIDEPFTYSFLDSAFDKTHQREANMNRILRIFAILTIFVACLGLFGLVTFSTEQRIKEIGIRKVLGSSVFEITSLLSKDFLKLVLIALVIAFPIGFYLLDLWLQDFEYRTNLDSWTFFWSGLSIITIAICTISFRSIKAALMNPVKSLRSE